MAESLKFTVTVTSSTTARFEVTDPSMADAGVNTTVTVYSDSSLQTVVTTVRTDQPLGSDSYGMGVATGLTPSTTYYAKIPQNTTTKSFTTFSGGKLYGSVSGQSKLVRKLYGSVETAVVTGVTGTVRAGSPGIGAGIAFDGEVFYNYVKNTIDLTKTLDYLLMHVGRFGETYTLTLYYSDGTFYAFENGSSQIDPGLYGITWTEEPQYTGDDYIDLTATTVLMSLSKEIKKLYGSVNGQTKLVYQSQ